VTSVGGLHASQPRMVLANGVELCVQTFGDPEYPATLLIGGAASSMDWWDDGFCERLSSGPRFVIRYDLRDTGSRSATSRESQLNRGTDLEHERRRR
jgi:pimeloyl-ACP methyl ester carboxylesterase